jgi:hypothetical protein
MEFEDPTALLEMVSLFKFTEDNYRVNRQILHETQQKTPATKVKDSEDSCIIYVAVGCAHAIAFGYGHPHSPSDGLCLQDTYHINPSCFDKAMKFISVIQKISNGMNENGILYRILQANNRNTINNRSKSAANGVYDYLEKGLKREHLKGLNVYHYLTYNSLWGGPFKKKLTNRIIHTSSHLREETRGLLDRFPVFHEKKEQGTRGNRGASRRLWIPNTTKTPYSDDGMKPKSQKNYDWNYYAHDWMPDGGSAETKAAITEAISRNAKTARVVAGGNGAGAIGRPVENNAVVAAGAGAGAGADNAIDGTTNQVVAGNGAGATVAAIPKAIRRNAETAETRR